MDKFIQAIIFTYVSTTISISTHQVFYVSPDNSTNPSCSSQPCATLSQYLLDNNGSLPVVSDVEYHFLPGEHHVPTNMTLQNLHNFLITGSQSFILSPTVIIGDSRSYVKIVDSADVIINNIAFKRAGMDLVLYKDYRLGLYNLVFINCSSCRIMNIKFLEYGFYGEDMVGNSYLSNIVANLTAPLCCFHGIHLVYTVTLQGNYHGENTLTIDKISMSGYRMLMHKIKISDLNKPCSAIHIRQPFESINNTKLIISNCYFYNMDRVILDIDSGLCANFDNNDFIVQIENCTFKHNEGSLIIPRSMIKVQMLYFKMTLTFLNCKFFNNYNLLLLSIEVTDKDICEIQINGSSVYFSKLVIANCSFFNNNNNLLQVLGIEPLACVNVYIGPIYITKNSRTSALIHINDVIVHINGPIYISSNSVESVMSISTSRIWLNGPITITNNEAFYSTLMTFQSSDVVFTGPINIINNLGSVMFMQSCNITFNGSIEIYINDGCVYILLLQYCDILLKEKILFRSNVCGQIIILKSQKNSAYIKMVEYSSITFTHNICDNLIAFEIDNNYNFDPFCIFQYVTLQNASAILPSHYSIIISEQYTCKLSFQNFISHCQWIPTAVFYGYNPGAINQQIIQLDHKHQVVNLHTTIFYCVNFSDSTVGPIFPGQALHLKFCMPCSDNHSRSILYAETHNALLPKSACKIAHQTELVNFVTSNSKTVNYTIVSEVNDSCELFLTVSPFLYYIYEVFDVKLLPCPIGFTLQNGICGCDPLLPAEIDTCYIDQSAIRRPANTWISYTQSGTGKYLISDCPMDYCLPFSSNVNFLYPDTQCQFNRTGILCSQCPHPLSMVFASSRCVKCTNVHILITVIVVVAGVVLVMLLYLLNLTVTKATINGMILYANIISINDSIFLMNNNIFKPLQVFISFVNLDLGIETCYYNGMDGYVKIWLQLFFPVFLIFMAFLIILASRYSLIILRLTHKRSLPVLATLFLLSYTGVLRTVLKVLFSYSTITHAPSGHQQLVWSVDASVTLFGFRFTVLFITCLVLFLILLFLNIILLFTRCLANFKLINHFKPILDAFQGSYKDRYYYWVAVYIILRSLFFALYAFKVKIRLQLATIILVLFTCSFGYICPNKTKLVNLQELLLLINLTIMHAVSYCSDDRVFGIITELMISLSFVQLCIIVIYHFFTFTCHCNIENTLQNIKRKLVQFTTRNHRVNNINIALLDIPECTYNYSEYQDELVSDDFAINL